MKGFKREDAHLVARFDTDEAALLAGLVDQLAELVAEDDLIAPAPAASSGSSDPFDRWEAEFSEEPGVEQAGELPDEVDPVIARLFPDAYPDDPAASWEFRRFTQSTQRTERVAEARLVMADLVQTDRRGRCRIASEHVDAWLKTLAAVRLALAVRLEITDEISADEAAQRPESDPRAWLHEVYQWMGFVQESLIHAITDY